VDAEEEKRGRVTQETRLLWLYNELCEKACAEHPLKPAHVSVLVVLLARDAAGEGPITKTELGAIVGLKERQVHSILTDLEGKIDDYLKKRRQGGSGKGRAANVYDIRPDATGNPVPPEWRSNQQSTTGSELPVASNKQSSAGNAVPSASPDRQLVAREAPAATGEELQVACGEVLPPMNRHASARAAPEKTISPQTEFYPERPEAAATVAREPAKILNGAAKGMLAHELSSKLIQIIDSPSLSPRSHKLAATCGEIRAWVDEGADFDSDIVPTVAELCQRMGGKPIVSWRYFSQAVRDCALTRIALAERERNVITQEEANAHVQQRPNSSYASAGRRRPRSVETDILMRDILDDPPRSAGRLDLTGGK
jgi:hypothetical protein